MYMKSKQAERLTKETIMIENIGDNMFENTFKSRTEQVANRYEVR